jgi:hypothetical protein
MTQDLTITRQGQGSFVRPSLFAYFDSALEQANVSCMYTYSLLLFYKQRIPNAAYRKIYPYSPFENFRGYHLHFHYIQCTVKSHVN